jgi:hypothetical protein
MKLRLILLLLLVIPAASSQVRAETFTGEIADSSCAYNVHSLSRSHKEMLKSKEWGKTAADCTRRCVNKFGASYVLVHNNDVYRLEQQEMAEKFAGQKVKIHGTVEKATSTIKIEEIEAEK